MAGTEQCLQAICDEEWLVQRSKQCLKTDSFAAKAWLITARTLFPKNFKIQYEAYCIEKNSRHVKEVAKILEDMFVNFPNEQQLWTEVWSYSEALQSEATDEKTLFQKTVFAAFPPSLQYHLLVNVAETTKDILQQCRLMLLVLNKYPDQVPDQGVKLIDSLLSTEKHSQQTSPVNCYRKYLVCHVLPQVLKTCTQTSPKHLYRWLQKAIEFYICYITQPPIQASSPLNSPDLQSPTSKRPFSSHKVIIPGLSEKESHINNPWEELFELLKLIGQQMDWDMAGFFDNTSCGAQWRRLQSLWESTSEQTDTTSPLKHVLYCATVLFFNCLYKYACHVDPHQFSGSHTGSTPPEPIILLEDVMTESPSSEHKAKKLRRDSLSATLRASATIANASELTDTFLTAFQCWKLLQDSDILRKEFNKLLQHWKYDSWTWLQEFDIDVLIYQGFHQEAITQLMTQQAKTNPEKTLTHLRMDLQLASCQFCAGNFAQASNRIFKVIKKLSSSSESSSSDVTLDTTGGRQLKLLSCKESEILPFCIQLLIACYREKAFNTTQQNDMALGHMIVLVQYDWPKYETLFAELLQKIRYQGGLTYNLFFNYVINIDILEEFAYLKNQEGNRLNLDILSTSAKAIAQSRTVTRGVNKGVKEDFKAAIEKQVSRSAENIEDVIRKFLIDENDLLHQNLL